MSDWQKIIQKEPGKPNRNHYPTDKPILIYYGTAIVVGEYRSAQGKFYYHNAPIYKQSAVTHWAYLPEPPADTPAIIFERVKAMGVIGNVSTDDKDDMQSVVGNYDFDGAY
jgi:hypothetical protein